MALSTLNFNYSLVVNPRVISSTKFHPPKFFTGAWAKSSKHVPWTHQFHQRQSSRVIESRVATLDVSEVRDKDDSTVEVPEGEKRSEELIDQIRTKLRTFEDGRISVSPYDTAFIALIKDVEGRNKPQFPSSLEWIAQHQLSDGSWGDEHFFVPYDRLLNTLACVVALRSWNVHADKSEKGISYIKENVHRLEGANEEHMLCGFEVIFPAFLQRARNLGIDDLPYDAPVVKEIYNAREKKLKRIPMEVMHKVPTSLLFSLEGLENLDWQKLLKLQSADGSFLTSPSSTAYAFMETKDEKCYEFIKYCVEKFNGGAPHTYPVDTFGRLWAVDRLQRLGISRFFESEIDDCLRHIYRVWTDKGIFSGRDSVFTDIDDTSMGIRLMRLQGYDVDPNVLKHFKNGDKFSCYPGQMIESSSPIYNLYRASQLKFPGEDILEEAKSFAYEFLQEKLANNQLLDKWVISEHLPDEIKTGLEMPWYASLPRVVTRYYLQHYAGADDVWIGKTLYRMEEISNNAYKDLAKLDFKRCQAQHQIEWFYMQEWYENHNVHKFGISRKELLLAYFLAASSIFEPERTKERIAWARSQIISKMVKSFLKKETTPTEQKAALVTAFTNNFNGLHRTQGTKREHGLVNNIVAALHEFFDGFDRYTSQQLKFAWGAWLKKLHQGEADWEDAELLATTLNISAGHIAFNEDILSHNDYNTLCNLTNKICHKLLLIQTNRELEKNGWNMKKSSINDEEIEEDMQALVKLVLEEKGNGINRNIRQTFLSVVKTYYYRAYYGAEVIDTHIFKVLFEPVV